MNRAAGEFSNRVENIIPSARCQTNATSSPYDAEWHESAPYHAALSCCHSASAAFLWSLNVSLLVRWRSRLKWLWNDAWTETNFCKLRRRLNFSIAYSRRRNGRWEFSHRLFNQWPVSCDVSFPITFIAARYERNLSVTISCDFPYRFISFLRKTKAALRSRRLET